MGNVIVDRVKKEAVKLQTLADELQVQIALGKAEAKDLIEKERKTLSKYISHQRNELAKEEKRSTENRRAFLTCVEDLEAILEEPIPAKPKAYDTYKNSVLLKVYELEEELRENYPTMESEMKETLRAFKVKMDAFRVNLALHDIDDPVKVKGVKLEFTEKLDEVRGLLSKEETAQSKLDNFVDDVSESFNYLKRAIGNLSN